VTALLTATVILRCDSGSGCLLVRQVSALTVNAAREFLAKNEGWTSTVVKIDGKDTTRDYCAACAARRRAVA